MCLGMRDILQGTGRVLPALLPAATGLPLFLWPALFL